MRKFILAAVALIAAFSVARPQDVINTYVGVAAQIKDGILTNAKLANMANSTVKCRITSGTGVPEDCSGPNINTITGVTTVGTAAVGQIPGVATNTVASAGNIGQIVTYSLARASGITLTTNTPANVTSGSFAAGNWVCNGSINYTPGTATQIQTMISNITLTTAGTGTLGAQGNTALSPPTGAAFTASNDLTSVISPIRFSLSTSTTIFLTAYALFTASTLTASGFVECQRTS